MNKYKLLGVAGLAASLLAAPAFAQNSAADTTGAGTNTTPLLGQGGYTGTAVLIQKDQNNTNNSGNNANNNRPSQRNPLLADNGYARAGKVIGTDVYNEKNQKLGSIDNILIGQHGIFAVISTNKKKVAVPFDQLKFGDANVSGHEKLVLPNMTQAQLNAREVVHYNETNYANNNNGNGGNNGAAGNNVGVFGNGNTGNGGNAFTPGNSANAGPGNGPLSAGSNNSGNGGHG